MAPRLPSFPADAVGSFDYDVANDVWTWSPPLYARWGLDPIADAPTTEAFFVAIQVEDRKEVRATLDGAVSSGLPFACRYRVVRPGSSATSILMVGDVTTTEDGVVATLHGYAIDVTDLLEEEASAAVEQSARHRASIEQVKGALMHTYGIDQDEAFDVLRSYSNTLNVRVATLAELVAQAMSVPTAGRPPGRRLQGGTLLDLLASGGGVDGNGAGVDGNGGGGVTVVVDGAPQPQRSDRQPSRD